MRDTLAALVRNPISQLGSALAALSAIRYNPTLAPYYQRKRQQGLQPKQALVAVMRRLLHLVYGVLKHQQPYNPDYTMT